MLGKSAHRRFQATSSVLASRRLLSTQPFVYQSAIQCTRTEGNNYKTVLSDKWNIGDSPNGGYVMSAAINAAQQSLKLKDPLSFTAYYLTKAVNAEADVSVEVLSSTSGSAVVQVSLSQEGVLKSRYMGTFGDLNRQKGISHSILSAPELPPIDKCLDAGACLIKNFGNHLTISHNTAFRLSAESNFAKQFLLTKTHGETANFDAWVALGDAETPSPESFPLFADFCPPVLNLITSFWVPTLEYNVHLWTRPTAEHFLPFEGKQWMRARYVTSYVKNGVLYTDAELWSADGKTLLCTGRQLAKVWLPKA